MARPTKKDVLSVYEALLGKKSSNHKKSPNHDTLHQILDEQNKALNGIYELHKKLNDLLKNNKITPTPHHRIAGKKM